MQQAGINLLRELDARGFRVQAAMWLYLGELGRWRFIIATPLVRSEGPRKLYSRIEQLLDQVKEPKPSIQDVAVTDDRESLMQAIGIVVHTEDDAYAGIRFSNNTVNDVPIDDAYIYRMAV